jgi:hypothetical protein
MPVYQPRGRSDVLQELWRRRVIEFFLKQGLIDTTLAASMLGWVHSGFSAEAANRALKRGLGAVDEAVPQVGGYTLSYHSPIPARAIGAAPSPTPSSISPAASPESAAKPEAALSGIVHSLDKDSSGGIVVAKDLAITRAYPPAARAYGRPRDADPRRPRPGVSGTSSSPPTRPSGPARDHPRGAARRMTLHDRGGRVARRMPPSTRAPSREPRGSTASGRSAVLTAFGSKPASSRRSTKVQPS